MTEPDDLDAILNTIREVGVSLERRVQRALGANLMIWGVMSAAILAFYQLVEWNPAPYEAALGPALKWVWIGPIAVGYLLSASIGARLGRMDPSPDARAAFRRGLIPALLATGVVVLLMLTGEWRFIPAAVVAITGASTTLFCARAPGSPFRTAGLAVGGLLVAAGLGLLFVPEAWTNGAAALVMLAGFGGLGAYRYLQAG